MRDVGIILNGVTGRMGTHQHLVRSILAIIQQGGVAGITPRPILTGRNAEKLKALAKEHGGLTWTTDLDAALADPKYEVFFDASGTLQRSGFVERAVKAKKAIYCEKPTATTTAEALRLAKLCEDAGLKNGVVQDKLWLPGIRKLRALRDQNFFGKILSVRGDFGYWVFTGEEPSQPPQRPSWNYRSEDGGGIIVDMFCHWQYLVSDLFGPIKSVLAHGSTDIPRRFDESGNPYAASADDSAYAIFELQNGAICQFNSSWCTRVRRDDLLTIQVDGTQGSCVAGLREAWVQSLADTPRPVWNPDVPQPINFFDGWRKVEDAAHYDNAFKIQWELFLRHVGFNVPFPWTLRAGAKGVALAEAGLKSWNERRWVELGN